MLNKVITIERHIIEEERASRGATGDFSALLRDLTLAIKIINREVSRAGLVDIIGSTEMTNIQGEVVQKLDEFANGTIFRAMAHPISMPMFPSARSFLFFAASPTMAASAAWKIFSSPDINRSLPDILFM